MRNPSNTSLIAFTANLLGLTTSTITTTTNAFPNHPSAFAHRRITKKSKSNSNNNNNAQQHLSVRLVTKKTTLMPRYFLDGSNDVHHPMDDNYAKASSNRDHATVYQESSSSSQFSLLKPYLEFNELDLQQLFHNDKQCVVSTTKSSSLYNDFQEVEQIGHYTKNSINSSTTTTTAGTTTSPFYFCQHKPNKTSLLPPWLSIIQPSMASSHLTTLRRDLSPHLSSKQISSVIDAIRSASSGNDVQLAGSADFCSLLVNSLEMVEVSALIGSVFHYCSCVSLLENEMKNKKNMGQSKQSGHCFFGNDDDENNDTSSWDEFDTKYLCALAGSGIEGYSPHSMKIALDAARLKSIEALASRVVKTSSHVNSSNLRSLLLSINEEGDWRALAIRGGACLYRLRGLRRWREERRGGLMNHERSEEERRVGHEALHIYAPLAARLGMFRLKTELEDAAFRTLYPHSHSAVSSLCATPDVGEGMKSVLSDISNQMKRLVQEDTYFMEHIQNVSITARLKEPYSIWRRMVKISKKGDVKLGDISILDIPDAVALRVVFSARKLTEDEPDSVTQRRERELSYYILNLCTETWPETSSSRFKDYVAKPKENGYQSLHYSSSKRWRGNEWPFEVQIRSSDMHRVAEFGLAAHWSYKRYGIDPPSSFSNASSCNPSKRILDKSSESYLKSVQEYQSREALKSYISPEIEYKQPMYIDDEIRAGRKRERDERLAPYLEALSGAQTDMTRENVYVFVSVSSRISVDESSDNNSTQGTVLSLPRGSRVLDAIRAAEQWCDSPIRGCRNGKAVLRNGRRTSEEQTERLVNGDVISIALDDRIDHEAISSPSSDAGSVKQLFSTV